MAGYPLLSVPPEFQGPSGEVGQIMLDGIVVDILLMHGRVDDEADWHVDFVPDPKVCQVLGKHLRTAPYVEKVFENNQIVLKTRNGLKKRNGIVALIRSELMVIDRHRNFTFDEKFDSADFTLPLRLSAQGSAHPAWDLGLFAADNQGTNHIFNEHSKLFNDAGRVYMQGALVLDTAHDIKVEIHPIDSIAFAMNKAGKTLSMPWGEPGWPTNFVKWRVAFFTNSKFHRINKEAYLKKVRTTTWYLDLPTNAKVGAVGTGGGPINAPLAVSGFSIKAEQRELWNGRTNTLYFERGVKSLSKAELATDPSDGRVKVKVTAEMEIPDNFGGIIVVDYSLTWNPGVFAPING